MATYIRLTDYKSSDEKEQEFFNPENRYEAKQEDFEKIPGSPIAYWVSNKIRDIFAVNTEIGSFIELVEGLHSRNNEYYLKNWYETNLNDCSLKEYNINKKWYPINKGGSFQKWYGNNEHIVLWKNDGYEMKNFKKATIGKCLNYFNQGITFTSVTSGVNSFRVSPMGYLYDVSGPTLYLLKFKEDILIFLSLLNTKVISTFIKLINPTLSIQIGDIKKLPIIFPKQDSIKQKIDSITQECINISKEEWDSRETSWDFAQNELLRILNDECSILNEKPKLETIYNRYCEYWRKKFNQLHQNEEELNRLFIDIYELQDELTPDVELKDITILKNEAKIYIPTQERGNEGTGGKLVFQADEIMKQFISYSVGVMFGRYSLDFDGLWIANIGQDITMHSHAEHGNEKVAYIFDAPEKKSRAG